MPQGKVMISQGKQVEGSFRQHAWQDTWETAYPIVCEGELSDADVEAIKEQMKRHPRFQQQPYRGAQLRYWNPETFVRVDKEKKLLITAGSCTLSD